jgi:mono/diheme cytochrome c family protein
VAVFYVINHQSLLAGSAGKQKSESVERMKRTPIFLVLALAGLLLITPLPAAAQTSTPAAESTPLAAPVPDNGRQSYAENCAPCHGVTGQGNGASASGLTVPPAALGQYEVASAKSLAEWFDITKNGRMQRMMPPWKDRLSDQLIWDTVAYAWGLHTTTDAVEQGKQVYEANCASCHGADGKGTTSGAADLSDFSKTSVVSQASWAEAVANGKGTMPAFLDKLSEAEQQNALVYVRSLSMEGSLGRQPLAKGTGVISGTVMNKTTGQPLADTTVLLGIFSETEMHEQREVETDAAGTYRFTDLTTDAAVMYAARVEYPTGVPYSSEFVTFAEGATTLDLPLSVYETTDDSSGLRAERIHYIMEFDAGRALVAELVVLSLDGDRAFADANGGILFTVPAGAEELGVNEDQFGGRFQLVDGGFVDLLPLSPGQNVRQVIYRYALPYTAGTLDFTRSLPYPASAVNALIADVGQAVSSEQLQDQGRRSTENGAYYNLLGQELAAAQPVVIKLTGLPSGSGSGVAAGATAGRGGGLSRGLLFLIIGLAAAIAAFLVALPLLRNRRAGLAGAGPAPLSLDREGLVDALAQLDVAYESGAISEAAYREQRLRLKAQLRDVVAKEA